MRFPRCKPFAVLGPRSGMFAELEPQPRPSGGPASRGCGIASSKHLRAAALRAEGRLTRGRSLELAPM
eukprot:3594142-Pyramimonas_sp.AAC.1